MAKNILSFKWFYYLFLYKNLLWIQTVRSQSSALIIKVNNFQKSGVNRFSKWSIQMQIENTEPEVENKSHMLCHASFEIIRGCISYFAGLPLNIMLNALEIAEYFSFHTFPRPVFGNLYRYILRPSLKTIFNIE